MKSYTRSLTLAKALSSAALLTVLVGCATTNQGPVVAQYAIPVTPVKSVNRFFYSDAPAANGYPNPWTVLENAGYVSAYDEVFENPAWVGYRLTGRQGANFKPPGAYRTDDRTKSKTSEYDYPAWYDLAHTAPQEAIALYYGKEAQEQTFLMTNLLPLKSELRRGPWKALEEMEHKTWAKPGQDIWVVSGPVYTTEAGQPINPSERYGTKQVAIPVAVFKVIMRKDTGGRTETLAFIMPQENATGRPPEEFLTSIREVEKRTGLNFFSGLPQKMQDEIEFSVAQTLWN